MKKLFITMGLLFLVTGLWAQNDKGAKVVTVSQAIKFTDSIGTTNFTMQVGLPYLGENINSVERITDSLDIRFPWDILYLFPTFTEAEGSFDVSKGYFGDKILISWNIRNNNDVITTLKLSRREYSDSPAEWADADFLKNISKTETEYEDKYVEGGVLYEYKLAAEGVSKTEAFGATYITGIGFRNPTAVITGNVSYNGGSPVKDVVVTAKSQGSSINLGSALEIPGAGQLEIEELTKNITTAATLQAWMRPKTAYTSNTETAIRLFQLKESMESGSEIDVEVNLQLNAKTLKVKIGDAEYTMQNFYPSGGVDSRGDDVLDSIHNFNKNFIHYSVQMEQNSIPKLFINGREINKAYETKVNEIIKKHGDASADTFNVTIPTNKTTLSLSGAETNWNNLKVGGQRAAYVDEIRIWKDTLSAVNIRTDYSRYIAGNNDNLISYLSANENAGQFAYDISRTGFNYNKNNGNLGTGNDKVAWAKGAGTIPTASQLGVLGVTDDNGNYEITSIPYSGTGESFKITPMYGLHQFEPGQQLVFLGEGSEVVNKIDFKDKSSFIFKGRVLFDTRGVFKSAVQLNSPIPTSDSPTYTPNFEDLSEGIAYIKGPGILDEGYNYYQKGNEKFDKGLYWLNDNGTPYDGTDQTLKDDDYLEKYASIYSEGVNIYIDGNIVLDENNRPKVTDAAGFFDVSVPIGNHYITLKKDGHQFTYNSRFPAAAGTFKEFFEDSNEAVVFIDETRVTVVGRVVGGSVESQKEIGFGENGIFQKTITDTNGNSKKITVSSLNNIGVANITLGYISSGTTVSLPSSEFNFSTNSETGEYRVEVMPLKYQLAQTNGLKIANNTDNIALLDSNLDLFFSEVKAEIQPEFEYPDGTTETGEPYNYEKSFTYRSTPVLRVLSQSSEKEIKVDGEMISTDGFDHPVYNQFQLYEIVLQSFEKYTNYDAASPREVTVPVTDGELDITNNLAFTNNELEERDANDASIINYTFRAGKLNISGDFANTLDIKYVLNDIPYEVENKYAKKGIVLGGVSDGTQTFVTASPDVPDIILRDPPGSNSFASIESGQSISFTTSNSYKNESGDFIGVDISLGPDIEITFGVPPGPSVNLDITADVSTGISTSTSTIDGNSINKTYTFNQTISTSDDPLYVGADGDLYIGQSKNYFYGSYNKVEPSTTIPTKNVEGELVEMTPDEYVNISRNLNSPIYISTQKRISFKEEPLNTFFIYSQKQIIDYLIPQLQLLSVNAITQAEKDADPTLQDKPGILTQEQYLDQVSLWRKLILENERSKYLVKNDRDNVKQSLVTVVDDFRYELNDAFSNADSGTIDARIMDVLYDKTEVNDKVAALLNSNFENNFSFDAGVGEFTRSVETTVVAAKSTEFNLYLNESIAAALGVTLNGVGMVANLSGYTEKEINSSLSTEEQTTTTISYTLKDNDKANLLSVDVVNLFDGYGPIFSTIGGVTSCPYEDAERSVFYNHADYDPQAAQIVALPEDKQEELSYATQRAEIPEILVTVASVSNVSESSKAEFDLILKNNSASETDHYFTLYVDNLTNPDNALINIEQNGTVVFVPYGQSVSYKMTLGKSASDVYDYENIRVVLESRCDVDVYSDVFVSAKFAPSCTEVELKAPLDNWVFNNRAAFNTDGSINKIPVEITGFNVAFNSFKIIDLEYRLASQSTWTKLQTYYGSQAEYDIAFDAGERAISLISNTDKPSYDFDIVGLSLPDGNYQLRARSSCKNETQFVSDVITGRVDLNSPQKFGTPLPIDGILGAGEDLRVSFNENIFYNSAESFIEIKGPTNQLPINNNVSLYFEGVANTMVINNPKITTGDLTLEFWMKMKSSIEVETASIITQESGLRIGLDNGEIYFTLGDLTTPGATIATDNLFHHYTFTHKNSTGELSIYQDDKVIAGVTGNGNLPFTNNNPLVIGGNTFIGNMDDLRLWNKTISLDDAYAKMNDKLIGNEANLIGYWSMDEGREDVAKDLARYKHAIVNASWDIKPKGTSYEFVNGQSLALDNVNFVQLTKEMDATVSFWMKTGVSQEATLFSNGRGDGTDIQTNGFANKWAINMNTTGNLTLESEGNSYSLTSKSVADDNWHNVTLLFNRIGSLRTYVDAAPVSSNQMTTIGGFSGGKIWLGARGFKDGGGETVDRPFTGKIDEFRLWNTLRNVEQISRDRFNEVDFESIGLLLYVRMNAPDPATLNGPKYYHAYSNQTVISTNAVLSSGVANYSEDVPAIKPERNLIKFLVNYVINEDEMIVEPVVTDWASLEGQILDITVAAMYDDAGNKQPSPITWTAYVKRNEVSWFAEGYNEIVDIVKNSGAEKSFEITLLNKGGKGQAFNISNIPSWLKLSKSSGTINPDSKTIITATIDKELTPGEYLENLYLQTDFGYDEKLQIKLRVLAPAPDWAVDPSLYKHSMNLVGRIKVDAKFSEDSYDKIAAFSDGKVRGSVNLVYNDAYQEYFAFLTVYSNADKDEDIEFKIWDSSQGKVIIANVDKKDFIPFEQNGILGKLSQPVIFANSSLVQQNIAFNKGWTWVSMNVLDANFADLNELTKGLSLETDDRIQSHSPARLETYYKDESTPAQSSWSGEISDSIGLTNTKMYKVFTTNQNTLVLKGAAVAISNWNFPIQTNWNWLPYILLGNQLTNEALAYFDATDGDVIKSQSLFAIYDPLVGWNGTLNYLESGTGYMIKSSKEQSFTYPNYLAKAGKFNRGKNQNSLTDLDQETIMSEFTQYAYNMNAVVSLPQGYDELFVYDAKGVLKGATVNQDINNKALSFITVYGEMPETLVFYIGDGINKKRTSKSFSFKGNDVLGTIAKPIIIGESIDNVTIYPNPFDNEITIKVNAVKDQVVSIQLYSLTGQMLLDEKQDVVSGENLLKIQPRVSTGSYLLQIKINGEKVINKVMKK
jgi:hypothetical protein